MSEYIHVVATMSNKNEAERIAKLLLEKRVAGCVQIIGPITSMYWWKGKIERAEEWLCLIKSRLNLYNELESLIRENHSYEIPEILAMPIIKGNNDYIKWLNNELKIG
ncbi:MAG: divalent-cation tolerance protein CutA [Nitrososphaerales archaeon]